MIDAEGTKAIRHGGGTKAIPQKLIDAEGTNKTDKTKLFHSHKHAQGVLLIVCCVAFSDNY